MKVNALPAVAGIAGGLAAMLVVGVPSSTGGDSGAAVGGGEIATVPPPNVSVSEAATQVPTVPVPTEPPLPTVATSTTPTTESATSTTLRTQQRFPTTTSSSVASTKDLESTTTIPDFIFPSTTTSSDVEFDDPTFGASTTIQPNPSSTTQPDLSGTTTLAELLRTVENTVWCPVPFPLDDPLLDFPADPESADVSRIGFLVGIGKAGFADRFGRPPYPKSAAQLITLGDWSLANDGCAEANDGLDDWLCAAVDAGVKVDSSVQRNGETLEQMCELVVEDIPIDDPISPDRGGSSEL